jgi:3-methyladenine DNA glycosylase AlkD
MSTPRRAAREALAALARAARPAGEFDASRYFRSAGDLGFYNVRTNVIRAMARRLDLEHRADWTLASVLEFADLLIRDTHLEAKALAIEVLARRRREFTPAHLAVWKRWLEQGHAGNWATTDGICGQLIGPLLLMRPVLARRMAGWTKHKVLWVRRAAAVSLVPLARRGVQLDVAYDVSSRLHHDRRDLLQKAVGWLLREAGKTDPTRLERYLLAHGPEIPRITVRYALERFPPPARRRVLQATRSAL